MPSDVNAYMTISLTVLVIQIQHVEKSCVNNPFLPQERQLLQQGGAFQLKIRDLHILLLDLLILLLASHL